MGLDIRLPIGMMFTLIGLMLTATGFLTRSDSEMYRRSLGININLVWGLVLLVFGGLMLVFALLGRKNSGK
jgi:Flp pilus assembly protein protease CpaA